jgi:hypothetical protein
MFECNNYAIKLHVALQPAALGIHENFQLRIYVQLESKKMVNLVKLL